jgi:hypothetical protein
MFLLASQLKRFRQGEGEWASQNRTAVKASKPYIKQAFHIEENVPKQTKAEQTKCAKG